MPDRAEPNGWLQPPKGAALAEQSVWDHAERVREQKIKEIREEKIEKGRKSNEVHPDWDPKHHFRYNISCSQGIKQLNMTIPSPEETGGEAHCLPDIRR